MFDRSQIKNVGVGLGLRRENSHHLLELKPPEVQCLEIAPENYFNTGGKLFREFQALAETYPIVFHGISTSLGSLDPIHWDYLTQVKKFMKPFGATWFSDHLCYSSVLGAQFHDLLPLPLSEEAIEHVVPRIRQIQDFLEMPFAIENVSSYVRVGEPEMKEWEFLSQVAQEADCPILLDVNNIYVNSVNFEFDPLEYLKGVPMERVIHIHMAGHRAWDEKVLLDNHGADVIDPVWELLGHVAAQTELPAVIVERDHNLPPFEEQIGEVTKARQVVAQAQRNIKLGTAS